MPCGTAHSPPSFSSNLPITRGMRLPVPIQENSSSFSAYSSSWRFSSTTRISSRPSANDRTAVASSGHTMPHLNRRMPMSFARLLVQAEVGERLARVQIRLAAGDDAEARVRRIDHRVIQLVGAAVRERGIQLVVEQPRFQFKRCIGPADVQSLGRHPEIGRE